MVTKWLPQTGSFEYIFNRSLKYYMLWEVECVSTGSSIWYQCHQPQPSLSDYSPLRWYSELLLQSSLVFSTVFNTEKKSFMLCEN